MGKRFTLNLLRYMEMLRGFLTEITTTTVIVAALYKGGCTIHSLLGLVVEEKDNEEKN